MLYGTRIRCLKIVSLHVPIHLQQFPSDGCLRDSAVLLGPKCSYVVLRLGTGQDMLQWRGIDKMRNTYCKCGIVCGTQLEEGYG